MTYPQEHHDDRPARIAGCVCIVSAAGIALSNLLIAIAIVRWWVT